MSPVSIVDQNLSTTRLVNISQRIRDHALKFSTRVALCYEGGKKTFQELDQESDAYARGFKKVGITRGTKTILMVKPGPELYPIVFALFKVGAVPVVVDPGMGLKRMLHCYQSVGAEAFVGIPKAQILRFLNPKTFEALKIKITVGRSYGSGSHTLSKIAEWSSDPFPIEETSWDDLLMINFTTGSTGSAKGAEYTHGMAETMVKQIEAQYQQGPESICLATLPLFAIFDLLIGSTSVLPSMDPTKPAEVNPALMVDTIQKYRITHLFASPAFLHRVGEYGSAQFIWLSSVRHVISGGAPVMPSILKSFRKTLSPDVVLHTTYGATEALPISSITDTELLDQCQKQTLEGKGTCVGRPLKGNEVRIITLSNDSYPLWSETLLVQPGEIGEILVSGESVSRRYQGQSDLNTRLKIVEGNQIWHRTGDLGWQDPQGRIWFCGRKSQVIETSGGRLHTVQWEGVFNAHPEVYRSALVGVGPKGAQTPVVCIELRQKQSQSEKARIENELSILASKNPITQGASQFLFHPSFPVDIRHNAKIGREILAHWADSKMNRGSTLLGVPRSRQLWMLVPMMGWVFIFFGVVFPFENPIFKFLWWVDLVLSLGAHGLQLALSLPEGKKAGFTTGATIVLTFLFGATWWKSLFHQKGQSA